MKRKNKKLTKTDKMIIYAKCHKGSHFFIKLALSFPFFLKSFSENFSTKKRRQNVILAVCVLLLLTISITSVLLSSNEDGVTYEMVFAAETGMFEPGYKHVSYSEIVENRRLEKLALEEAEKKALEEAAVLAAAEKQKRLEAEAAEAEKQKSEARYNGIISEDSQYRIGSYADLCTFRDYVNEYHPHASAILVADIEADPADGYFTPIANSGNNTGLTFEGTFDGNGFSIMGLRTSPSDRFCGLFGTIGTEGIVRELTLTESSIFGTEYIGAIAAENNGTITGCETFGNVTANEDGILIGGITGSNGGTIADCKSSCRIAGGGYAGGIAGENYGTISGCSYSGSAECGISLGGIAGQNEAGTIDNCTCFSYALLTGQTGAGGIAGTNGDEAVISNCRSYVSPAGIEGCGDVIGINYGKMEHCCLMLSDSHFDYEASTLIGLDYGKHQ